MFSYLVFSVVWRFFSFSCIFFLCFKIESILTAVMLCLVDGFCFVYLVGPILMFDGSVSIF